MKSASLHSAVMSNDTARIEQLLAEGADINHLSSELDDINSYTPLRRAIRFRCQESAITLIKHGAELGTKHYENSLLHYAAWFGNEKVVEWLILARRFDTNYTTSSGESALHVCLKVEVARVLLAHGAEINAKNLYDQTALHTAASSLSTGVICLLIHNGIDVNSQDIEGKTALHTALAYGYADHALVKLFFDYGANANARTKRGKSILHSAYLNRRIEPIVREVLAHGLDIDAQDDQGFTPLHRAVEFLDLVQVYLEEGAEISLKTNQGESPLELVERYIETERNERLKPISEYLSQHIVKLKVAGLYVSKENLLLAESILRQPNERNLRKYDQECKLELTMFKLKIDLGLNYLLTTQYPNYIANKDLCNRIEGLINCKEYPIYGKMILKKFAHDTERHKLIETYKNIMIQTKLKPTLPEEIWAKILSRLTNKELRRV